MSNVIYKKEKLSDLFTCKSGNSKYTKSYCNSHNGEYEVYTGSTLQKFASLDTYDYDEPNLTFTTDGEYAGTLKVLEGKYNVGGHRKILIKKDENIDLNYFCTILQPLFYAKVKDGDVPSVNWNEQLSKLVVNVPVNKDGTYNIEKQREIALKFQEIENKKNNLLDKVEYLKKTKIDMTNNLSNFTYVEFNKMFKLERGTIISKAFIASNKGRNPVYSTQKDIFGYINSYMKEGKYLLWNTDGLAGYIKITNGKFSYTNIVGIMIPTNYYDMSLISLDYLKNYLEPVFRKNRKGRFGINGKNEYTKINSTMIKNLNIKIPIPITDNGDYDIEKQREIAQKIATIESIKSDLCNKVIELTNITVI
ncbi:restriction endonuclease subunit S [bacterium]|nr:restriction endonuclease subunit S [bacterium]